MTAAGESCVPTAAETVARYDLTLAVRLVEVATALLDGPDPAGFADAWTIAEQMPSGVLARAARQPLCDAWVTDGERLVAAGVHRRYPELHPARHLAAFTRLLLAWTDGLPEGASGVLRLLGPTVLHLWYGAVALVRERTEPVRLQWRVRSGSLRLEESGRGTVAEIALADHEVQTARGWRLITLLRARGLLVDMVTPEYTGIPCPDLADRLHATLDTALAQLSDAAVADVLATGRCVTFADAAAPWMAGLFRLAPGTEDASNQLLEAAHADLAERRRALAPLGAALQTPEPPLPLFGEGSALQLRKSRPGLAAPLDWSALDALSQLDEPALAEFSRDLGSGEAGTYAAALLAYMQGEFRTCRERLAGCLTLDPDVEEYRHLFAFTARHEGDIDTFEQLVFGAVREREPAPLLPPGRRPPQWRRRLRQLIDVRGGGARQLPQYVAVLAGLKTALDDWVPRERLEAYHAAASALGLVVRADCLFVHLVNDLPGADAVPTTHARGLPLEAAAPADATVHVVVATRPDRAAEALAAAWYPVAVGGRIVSKPRIDHLRFGRALGYPECCVRFFLRHNDWRRLNSLVEAARASRAFRWPANCLPKRTPAMAIYHLPCAFDCAATIRYGTAVIDAVADFDATYAHEIGALLRGPFLAVTEQIAYALRGGRHGGGDRWSYDSALYVGGDPAYDRFGTLLAAGDTLSVDDGVLLVWVNGQVVGVAETRCDAGAVEAPLVLCFE